MLLQYSCSTEKENNSDEYSIDRPNILIAISDDQSFPHTSAYGSGMIQTPGFDRVAKDGILFMNCITPSPGCAPSRSGLLTGRYPWQNEQAGQHASEYPQKFVTFPDRLEANGYHVGYTGKG
ncbi:MAG: sulfatase-like hydrolase/transferase, partial [Cyclobacteriaceae bacterium]|nr:sulfatase-like hydrolase/transferase [Cyclobacteriaceae bacterium]